MIEADRAVIPNPGRVLGLDFGSARVGVAISDRDQRLATGSTRIDRVGDREREHRAMAALVDKYEVVGVVVGLPLSLSGRVGPAATATLAEVEDLRRRLAVPVDLIDERLSTVSATASLRAAGRAGRRQRPVIDQTAAAVFLQVWLDRRLAPAGGGHHG
jgi:putative Holliday junction resolvase